MIQFLKQFGGKIDKSEIQKLSQSKHWVKNKFENLQPTSMDINPRTIPGLLKKQFTNTKNRRPKENLPIVRFEKDSFEAESSKAKFIWYGHSVLLIRMNGKSILFDPMFGPDASPIGPIRTNRFSENTLEILQQLPAIDIVLMSHDHYDHLDLASYEILKDKVKEFYVPLGVKRHLIAWGIESNSVTELDWYDNFTKHNIYFEFTPSRHFTGRGLSDRVKSLWGGFVIKSSDESIFISGDGGYGHHFKTIGEKHGPFDIAFLECGQYNVEWHQIHMYPEESIQAALDVKTKVAVPIHWGGFKLALHDWKDPIHRFVKEAKLQSVQVTTPKIGELITLGQNESTEAWWENYS